MKSYPTIYINIIFSESHFKFKYRGTKKLQRHPSEGIFTNCQHLFVPQSPLSHNMLTVIADFIQLILTFSNPS